MTLRYWAVNIDVDLHPVEITPILPHEVIDALPELQDEHGLFRCHVLAADALKAHMMAADLLKLMRDKNLARPLSVRLPGTSARYAWMAFELDSWDTYVYIYPRRPKTTPWRKHGCRMSAIRAIYKAMQSAPELHDAILNAPRRPKP